jgi:hypothetical protein
MAVGRTWARGAAAALLIGSIAACGRAVEAPAEEAPAAVAEPASPAEAPSTFGFRFDVDFDRETQAKLTDLNEKVTVSVAYYGEPTAAAAPRYSDQTPPVVDLGEEVATIDPVNQGVSLTGKVVNTMLLPDVEGPVKANVNIYTARMSGPDNLISCPLVDAAIVELKSQEVSVSCALIEP